MTVKTDRIVSALGTAFLWMVLAMPGLAFADLYTGQTLLEWSRNIIIAPIGLLAVVVGVAAAIFRPEMVKGAIWTAVVCVVLFTLISKAGDILQNLQATM